MSATGQYKLADGCRLAYRLDGDEGLPTLVLSNSLGTTHAMWDAQLAAFTRTHRVLRYDARGHGGSDSPAGAYGIDRLGRDVLELLDGLGLDRIDFCGLSLGGMVGQWLGYRAPERIDRLVLANTSAFLGPASAWDKRIELVCAQGMAAIADLVLERWFTPEFRASNNSVIARAHTMLLSTSALGYAGSCAALRDLDLRPTASLIAAPSLVIAGERDPATPLAHAEALVAAMKVARLATLPAAHLSNLEQPDAFARLVGTFLGGGNPI